jgi:outer membrane cobalamin receptor
MMRRTALTFALVVATIGLTVSSCSRHGSSRGRGSPPTLISRDDIERAHAHSALEAVQRYRSDVLIQRAPSSVLLNKRTYPVVFLNDQFLGQIDELRNFPADGIEEIHILNGVDAQTRFGSQYGGGIIQIIARAS